MIYLVYGEESDYDYYNCKKIYASKSKDKAERKLAEVQSRMAILKKAKEEYNAWFAAEMPFNKFVLERPEEVTRLLNQRNCDYKHPVLEKWGIDSEAARAKRNAYIDDKLTAVGAAWGFSYDDMRSNDEQLTFTIEEVPSDDDD